MLFEFDSLAEQKANIKVIGVGGAGGNAVNRMIQDGMDGVDFLVINTDAQDLDNNSAENKLQIGKNLTKGLGAGAHSEIGQEAIESDKDVVKTMIQDANMVFITAGMGGGTGTGAAPTVAQIAREMGILTVGIVTLPFNFEGPKRMKRGVAGVDELRKACDTLIVIPNQRLMTIIDKNTTLVESFKMSDSILHHASKGISDLINVHGLVNLDFADVVTVMKNMGEAVMGTGIASGEERAELAAQQAISSPLLENASISGAQGVLVNITGGPGLTLIEVDQATKIIFEQAGEDANIIFGAVIDPDMGDDMMVTVIATGFNQKYRNELVNESTSTKKNNLVSEKTLYKSELKNVPLYKKNDDLHGEDDSISKIKSFGSNENPTNNLHSDLEVPAFIRRQHN